MKMGWKGYKKNSFDWIYAVDGRASREQGGALDDIDSVGCIYVRTYLHYLPTNDMNIIE
jgi:hypothetical protein